MVAFVNSDEKKSDEYWMGVRDALRMVDSFLRFRRKQPKRMKTLEDFIADGLVSAAKRCKSCLSKELGITFKEDKAEHEGSPDIFEPAEPAEVPVFFEESSFDSAPSPEIYESAPPSELDTEEGIIEPIDYTETESPSIEEATRDFSSDFELVEPEPLITKPEEIESEAPPDFKVIGPPEIDLEEELQDVPEGEISTDTTEIEVESPLLIEEEPISEESESPTTPSRFSWDDHDEISTPGTPLSDSETEPPQPEEPSSAKVRLWSPIDEPSDSEPITTDDSDYIPKEMEDEVDEPESETTTEEPPAPPPPPESDETEEERKRRARRLFFGT